MNGIRIIFKDVKKLRRKNPCLELKIDKPLDVAFRRGNAAVKKSRIKFFAYERQVFFMNTQRCAVEVCFHIPCTN